MVVREANGRPEGVGEMQFFADERGARTLKLSGSESRAVLIKVGLGGRPFIELHGADPDPLPELLMRDVLMYDSGRIVAGIQEVVRGRNARLRVNDYVVFLRNNGGVIEVYARRPNRRVPVHVSRERPDAG